jgi:NADH dehydrogenase
LVKSLADQIPPEELDRHGQPLVNGSLQLLSFPEVFAGGDCVTVKDNPKPALAQIAYQQGAALAKNLMALQAGKPLVTPDPQLRGTLMKLGLGNGVANLFDRVRIEGKTGDLLRNATYLELLPTPLHNFKATTQWLQEETIDRFHRPHAPTEREISLAKMTPSQRREYQGIRAIAIIAPLTFIVLLYLGFTTPERERRPFNPLPTPSVNQ